MSKIASFWENKDLILPFDKILFVKKNYQMVYEESRNVNYLPPSPYTYKTLIPKGRDYNKVESLTVVTLNGELSLFYQDQEAIDSFLSWYRSFL